uniref:Uncharacterized protein n=1 Tax=mine drainage metagenome TaxID=410659 RepID=E6PQM3_9ZZZZ
MTGLLTEIVARGRRTWVTPLYGRNNPIMGGIVAQYDAQQLHDIAAYVASLKGPLYIRGELH